MPYKVIQGEQNGQKLMAMNGKQSGGRVRVGLEQQDKSGETREKEEGKQD